MQSVMTPTVSREVRMDRESDDMNTQDVAALLGVSITRVNQLINQKEPDRPKLRAYRVPGFGTAWRVERSSVMRYLEWKARYDAAVESVPWEDED